MVSSRVMSLITISISTWAHATPIGQTSFGSITRLTRPGPGPGAQTGISISREECCAWWGRGRHESNVLRCSKWKVLFEKAHSIAFSLYKAPMKTFHTSPNIAYMSGEGREGGSIKSASIINYLNWFSWAPAMINKYVCWEPGGAAGSHTPIMA